METKIIASFPATGKTTAGNKFETVLDLESSDYLYERKEYEYLDNESFKGIGNRKKIPNGYCKYAQAIIEKANSGKYSHILIASNPEVIKELIANKLNVIFVKPKYSKDVEEEFIKRAKERGNNKEWIEKVKPFLKKDPFDDYTKEESKYISVLYLSQMYYLSDLIEKNII